MLLFKCFFSSGVSTGFYIGVYVHLVTESLRIVTEADLVKEEGSRQGRVKESE